MCVLHCVRCPAVDQLTCCLLLDCRLIAAPPLRLAMPSFSVPIPPQSRVLYLAHSADESNDSVGVELAQAAVTHLPVDKLAGQSGGTAASAAEAAPPVDQSMCRSD